MSLISDEFFSIDDHKKLELRVKKGTFCVADVIWRAGDRRQPYQLTNCTSVEYILVQTPSVAHREPWQLSTSKFIRH